MKKRNVIPGKYIPVKLPFTSTVLQLFLLYYFNVPDWVLAVYITIAALIWIALIANRINEVKDEKLLNPTININNIIKELNIEPRNESKFKTKLNNAIKEAKNNE
ncbi:hypothetical protein HSX10_03520 [Winogradskyella undariae]|uniref:hypothetical protein n=1 Tax=Winogradskyella undariae TaxID=1285465 RepID=UPI00156B35BD|nr:hypothetical protein [Winogradskyella undariae]NRR90628.1 hypothetical protein [Winogradskyella undariae]